MSAAVVADAPISIGGNLTPIPVSVPFLRAPQRFVCLLCGRRGTKTYTGARKFGERIYRDVGRLQRAEAVERGKQARGEPFNGALIYAGAHGGTAEYHRRKPRAHYWIVAETFDLLDESMRALGQVIPTELIEHTNSSERSWWLWPDVLVEARSGKDPKRLVGAGLDGIWLEEAARLHPTAWAEFLRPALADKQGWAIATTTPLGFDWTYEHFEVPAGKSMPDYAFFSWFTEDNPHIAPEEIALARATLAPEYFEREFHARRDVFHGQIYRHWKEAYAHDALPKDIQFQRVLGGVDWGISNPGAEIVIGITRDDQVWAFDEVYEASELVEDFWVPKGLALQKEHRFNEWCCDPAEPDNLRRFSNAGMRAVGHRNYGSGKFDEHARSVLSGIRTVASTIHRGKLHIVKTKCPNLYSEIRNYRWEQDPRGNWLEHPAKHQKDHAVTALRYAISYAMRPPTMRGM